MMSRRLPDEKIEVCGKIVKIAGYGFNFQKVNHQSLQDA